MRGGSGKRQRLDRKVVEILGGGMAALYMRTLTADSELIEPPLGMIQRQANDNSGYIGAGIVGAFVLVVSGWYGGRWAFARWKRGSIIIIT